MATKQTEQSRIAVVHLARCANGLEPLTRFLESYAAHPAGQDHDLIVVFKGYQHDACALQAAQALLPANARELQVDDAGLDLDAYRAAFRTFDYAFFCFLNSFSCINATGWLRIMMRWAEKPQVGIVGATGSYQSIFADEINALAIVSRHYLKLCVECLRTPGFASLRAPAAAWMAMPADWRGAFFVHAPRRLWRALHNFPTFPNYHIRTNAFLMRRELLRALNWPPMANKYDAYRFESGRNSITAQVLRLGLEPVVVGRDGEGYFRDRWHTSRTFWQDEQDNLLIEDNQTREYTNGSEMVRGRLRRYAWRKLSLEEEA